MFHWLKSTVDNLKTKLKDAWKYACNFKENEHVVTELKIGESIITQPQ
jgi:hypothetical protein